MPLTSLDRRLTRSKCGAAEDISRLFMWLDVCLRRRAPREGNVSNTCGVMLSTVRTYET